MKVCYFGTYDPAFTRNAIIIEALRQNGVEVVECNRRAWVSTDEKIDTARKGLLSLRALLGLALCWVQLIFKYVFIRKHDAILVGYTGHFDVFLARALATVTRKPLILDAFLSLYETAVEDRRIVPATSMTAKLMRFVDRSSCKVSDLVLLDTNAHIDYFVEEFGLPREKFRRVLATADAGEYKPTIGQQKPPSFKAIYFGQFIPLHGVEHIIEAAGILAGNDKTRFVLCGVGQTLEEMKARARRLGLNNVEFVARWMSPWELSEIIDDCDLCLGVFGDSWKALRVIPNKVFVGIAKGKPVLSGDSPAIREVFAPDDTIFLCQSGDPRAIAEAITRIREDEELRLRVATNGYSVYERLCTPQAAGARLREDLRGMCG